MRTLEWNIEDVLVAHPGLYLEHCVVMAVAVMSRVSKGPCEFVLECKGFTPPELNGETSCLLRIAWNDQTARKAERVWRTEQTKPIVERAAVAIAAMLFAFLIPGGRMRVTSSGDRADYWLPQLNCGLEISGTQLERELSPRCREKSRQVLENPRRWNGYVVVACFSESRRKIQWSYHTQEELQHGTS